MSAYAAVVSLKQTIERILESSRISLVPPSHQIIQRVRKKLDRLLSILGRLDYLYNSPSRSRKRVNALDGRIKEAVWKFEDLLESHLLHHIISEGERERSDLLMLFSIDLQVLQQDVDSFVEKLKNMREEYQYELENMPLVEEDELGLSGADDYGGIKTEMVGLSDYFEYVRDTLTKENKSTIYVFSLVGTAGIGKTTLAKKIYEDPATLRCFQHRSWVAVGRKSRIEEVALIIGGEYLKAGRSEGERCLIVLDDVWDTTLFRFLSGTFPDGVNGRITILLTTKIHSVGYFNFKSRFVNLPLPMPYLNVEESKDLLRLMVFGEEAFPPQLEEAAEKIAKNCEGLPLMILAVADRLSKAKNNDPQHWDEVARKRSSVFMDAYDELSKVLFPAYDFLDQDVKMIFTYMGAFHQDYEISVSKLINLLTAESFAYGLKTFVDRRLIENGWWNESVTTWNRLGGKKSCSLHSWWWFLFNKEASKEKFFRVLNSGVVNEENGIKGQRRLCLHSNFIFSFKEVHNLVKCDCASTARSLLCFGPYYKYSMPLDVGFKLLRVLDALKVRFYTFPFEILELVLLQYLALTYSGKLPTSISKLFNLQFLIIHPHMSIRSREAPSHVPVQIWDMQELTHIDILGSNLPSPNSAASLQKLNAFRCER